MIYYIEKCSICDEMSDQRYENGILSIFELFMATKYEYAPCEHEELADE